MKIGTIAKAVTNRLGRPILVGQKNAPTILFVTGVVGVVATVVLASRATLKLDSILDKAEVNKKAAKELDSPDYSEKDRQQDLVKVYTQAVAEIVVAYGPAFLVGVASIGMLSGSHIILNRRNAGLMAAYGALDRGFKEYRKRVVAELGPEKDEQFRYDIETRDIVEETPEGPVVTSVKIRKDGRSIYARLWDEHTSKNWSREGMVNQFFIQCQQNYLNDMLRARGHMFLNEVHDALGLERTSEGAVVGWTTIEGSGDGFISFGIFDGDDIFDATRFVHGNKGGLWLDFNVDGVIWDKI